MSLTKNGKKPMYLRDKTRGHSRWGQRQHEAKVPMCMLHHEPLDFDVDWLGHTVEGCVKCPKLTPTNIRRGTTKQKGRARAQYK
jgi:hypothetical protein